MKLPFYSNDSEFQTQRERTWPLNIVNVATRFFAAIPQSNINQKHKKHASKQTDTHATNAQNEVPRLQAGAALYIFENLGMSSCRN